MTEPEKITIIEGPTPVFEPSLETWLPAMAEGPYMPQMAMCRVRTFNGPALVERCHRAWQENRTVNLEYRSPDGLDQEAQILGARNVELDEGHLLLLWVRVPGHEVQMEFGFSDDDGFEDPFGDDPDFPPDLF